MRAGVEVRSYDNMNFMAFSMEIDTSPYVEFTLNYAVAQNTSLTWTNRYWMQNPMCRRR